jgi:CDP-diglyceride synthetase
MTGLAGAPAPPAQPGFRRVIDPRTADPRTADPRTADPRTADPRTADPRTAGHGWGDGRTGGPATRAPLADPGVPGGQSLGVQATQAGPGVPLSSLPPPPIGASAPAPAPAPKRARVEAPLVPPETGPDRLFAVPDVNGPRTILGVAWFLVLVPAAVLGGLAMAALFGAVAAFAAWGTARAWRRRGFEPDHRLAAGAAVAVSLVAAVHVSLAGVLLMCLPVVAVLAAAAIPTTHVRRAPVLGTAGATLRSVVPPCIAVVGIMLVAQSGPWVLLVFVLLVSAYDAGNFLIGAEARTPIPGIIGGILCTVVVGVPLMVSQLPPFDGRPIGLVFAGLVGVVAPLGQMVASLSLPASHEWVGPLRRIDAYILTGPLFAWVMARFLALA